MKKLTINFAGVPFTGIVRRSEYANNGAPALLMDGEDGEPIAVLSTNLTNEVLLPNEIAIKDYSENEGVLASLVEQGVVRDTGRRVPSGWVQIPIAEIIAPEFRRAT